MRIEGILTTWNDDRGFGYIESTQGGQPIFVHISAWPRGSGRPLLKQAVSFEVEVGPRGKRARNIQLIRPGRAAFRPAERTRGVQWGTATLVALPVFLLALLAIAYLWRLPAWVLGLYVASSIATFRAYAADKRAAACGERRTPEQALHLLALAGGWPGALLAQQYLRHKSAKEQFRQVFWATVVLNSAALVVLASPLGRRLLGML